MKCCVARTLFTFIRGSPGWIKILQNNLLTTISRKRHNNNTMNSGTGIQELMAAETRASQIVAQAMIGKQVSIA